MFISIDKTEKAIKLPPTLYAAVTTFSFAVFPGSRTYKPNTSLWRPTSMQPFLKKKGQRKTGHLVVTHFCVVMVVAYLNIKSVTIHKQQQILAALVYTNGYPKRNVNGSEGKCRDVCGVLGAHYHYSKAIWHESVQHSCCRIALTCTGRLHN